VNVEEQIAALQQEQHVRLNQLASSDPVWQRIAGKLEILQALKDSSPALEVVTETEDDKNGTLG
tara:strand:- start:291 stop:482 length:192 start_codon:yes stop_codon:yes gene_type:complete